MDGAGVIACCQEAAQHPLHAGQDFVQVHGRWRVHQGPPHVRNGRAHEPGHRTQAGRGSATGNTVRALAASLKSEGQLLLVEPPGHCSRDMWSDESAAAEQAGLVRVPHPSLEGRRMFSLWRKRG